MDWDKLKIFHTVAEASSFTKASTILNLSQSAISRQIQALENDLKVQLFVFSMVLCSLNHQKPCPRSLSNNLPFSSKTKVDKVSFFT